MSRLQSTVLALAGVLLQVVVTGTGAAQTTERVSVSSAGAEGNNHSYLGNSSWSVSADGRHVAFSSFANNLVSGDTNSDSDVFVRDRQTGITERVSVDSAGGEGSSDSYADSISADGRYVTFHSYATDLVPGDTNSYGDVFVHDRQTGITERVSVDSAGTEGNLDSYGSSASGDGRFVAFHSAASNLVSGDTNSTWDVFVHDRQTGITERVSTDSAGTQGDRLSWHPSISRDGRYVAFESNATNLVPDDSNGVRDIFVHDRQTGITERVSVDSAGGQGNIDSVSASISADGRYVAFESASEYLVPGDTNHQEDIFVHDRETGTTERVSVDSAGGQGDLDSRDPSISADGRYVAFGSWSSLVPDLNGEVDAFVHDRQTGITERVSVDPAGGEGNGASWCPSISGDGGSVAFHSDATNLVPGDTTGGWDVFVRDRWLFCDDFDSGSSSAWSSTVP